jgi:transcriptional regulator with XRE-family HTH domain
MLEQLTPVEIEVRAKRAGLSMKQVCEKAAVSPSTFSRWKHGKLSLSIEVFSKLYEATAPIKEPAND